MQKKRVAISIGDINGIGLEIAIRAHAHISQYATPIYCVHKEVLEQAYALLESSATESSQTKSHAAQSTKALPKLPESSLCPPPTREIPLITPGAIDSLSGAYSYASFTHACDLVDSTECAAVLTLPIHKLAWKQAGIPHIGHTDALKNRYGSEGIMMLGCQSLFVALFSDHIALKDVSARISAHALREFLLNLTRCVPTMSECAVLGLNPHCGDGGLMGEEDALITQAIVQANEALGRAMFVGAMPPDSAFSPHNRARFRHYVSMYHDVGLAPLKALYFEQSINVTLNLPILRTSVDHGVAFDKAYKARELSLQSYINALKYVVSAHG